MTKIDGSAQTTQTTGTEAPAPSLQKLITEDYKNAFNNAADKAIMELGLPKDQSARLYDALANPALGSKLSPDEQALLKEITPKVTAQVTKEIATKYNLPSNWSPLVTDEASWIPTKTGAPSVKSAKGIGEAEYIGKSTLNGVPGSGPPGGPPAPPAKFPTLPKPQLDQPVPYAKYDKMVIQTTFDEAFKKDAFEGFKALNLPADQTQKLYNALINPEARASLSPEEQAMVKDMEAKITPTITKQVAAQFNLPGTWSLNSKDPASWTPLAPAHIDPTLREALFSKIMGETAVKSLESTLKAGEKTLKTSPPNHPNTLMLKDFLKLIASALQEVRNMMRNLQFQDADKDKKLSTAKFDTIQEKIRMNEEVAKKMAEAAAKMKSMGDLTLAMKILGPILSAVGTALGCGVGSLIFALGFIPGLQGLLIIGAVMVATSLIVGAVTLALSIADSSTGFMGQMMEAIGKSIDASIERDCKARGVTDPAEIKKCQLAAKICTAIIVIIAVIILAVVLVALLAMIPGVGADAAEAGVQTTIQAITEFVLAFVVELTKSLVSEGGKALLMAIFMAAMQVMMQAILDAVANDPNISKEGKEAIKWLLMIGTILASLVLGAVMGAGGKGSKGGVEKTATKGIETAKRTVSQAVKQLTEGFIKAALAAMDEVATSAKNAPKVLLKSITNGITDAAKGLMKLLNYETTGKTISEAASREAKMFLQGLKDTFVVGKTRIDPASGKEILKSNAHIGIEYMVKIMGFASDLAKELPGAAGCAQGIATGVIMLRVADIMRQKGEFEASMEILQAVADLLGAMLKKLESGMEGRQEDIAGISDMIKNYFSKIDQSVGASFQALNAKG